MMAEFHCWPLWHVGPRDVGNIDPETLPISEDLKHALSDWATRWDEILDDAYPPDSAFPSQEAEEKFHADGLEIFNRLQLQLDCGYLLKYQRT